MPDVGDSYSQVADRQLDAIDREDPELYREIVTACALVFDDTGRAQLLSTAITTREWIRMRLPVPGRPHKVFWSSQGPRIEAVFPYSGI